MEYCKWINCELTDEKILQGHEETTNLCLSVASMMISHHKISEYLSKPEIGQWATSLCLLLIDIMIVRFAIISNQVALCPAFKVASDEKQETPTMVASIKLNELFSDLTNKESKAKILMPEFWFQPYKAMVIGLCRLDKFTSYMRIPPGIFFCLVCFSTFSISSCLFAIGFCFVDFRTLDFGMVTHD